VHHTIKALQPAEVRALAREVLLENRSVTSIVRPEHMGN
jgi:hypothetical protein